MRQDIEINFDSLINDKFHINHLRQFSALKSKKQNEYKKFQFFIVNLCATNIFYIKDPDEDIQLLAVKKDPRSIIRLRCINNIRNFSSVNIEAVKQNSNLLSCIPKKHQSVEACITALQNDPSSIKWVKLKDNETIISFCKLMNIPYE